ncbi:E3 ubiquitin-protein ligase LRSAM1-like [Actinia tenebrosa]|uniref:E3 ubiquitin-protein ligase LRSAM1-like n=1 Tax=Actinia tenebrosa TaxID=6105 RepID=A0A6P8J3Z9_ACTTE|nr:E3 ubiquitin-protein ligase LRSAM1-like [Actinia tenebrosa]
MPLFRTRKVDKDEAQRRIQRCLVVAEESPEPSLDLSGCGVTELPKDVFSLCRVLRKEVVLLCDNDLSGIKSGGSMKDLVDVKVLDLRDNRITSLPNEIKELKSLQVLNVQNNKLKTLPTTIGALKSLQTIDLQGNNLTSLPDAIGNLENLKKLNLSGNPKLESLPASLAYCRLLDNIILDVNTVNIPPREVTKQGTEAILKYLSQCAGIEYMPSAKRIAAAMVSDKSQASSCSDSDIAVDKMIAPCFLCMETLSQHDADKEHKQSQMYQMEKIMMDLNDEQKMLANRALKTHSDLVNRIREAEADMDDDILWLQNKQDLLRQNWTSALAADEQNSKDTVAMILQINERARDKEAILDQLENERIRTDNLVQITQEESEKLRKEEILASMARMLAFQENQDRIIHEYQSSRDNIAKMSMKREAAEDDFVWDTLNEQDKDRKSLKTQISNQEHTQMQAIQALQLQKDAKHCRLTGQIKLLEDQLAHLTMLEFDKREERQDSEQLALNRRRSDLSSLLGLLIIEQEKRESELMERLNEMERRRETDVQDYWLIQYQRLLDNKPATLLEKECDPEVAETLREADAEDFIALFARHHITWKMLTTMTTEELKEMGVRELGIRKAILDTVEARLRVQETTQKKEKELETPTEPEPSHPQPSAPAEIPVLKPSGPSMYPDCVICMDKKSDVVLLNCGHVCCCFNCSSALQSCPICRSPVVQRVKIYVA